MEVHHHVREGARKKGYNTITVKKYYLWALWAQKFLKNRAILSHFQALFYLPIVTISKPWITRAGLLVLTFCCFGAQNPAAQPQF